VFALVTHNPHGIWLFFFFFRQDAQQPFSVKGGGTGFGLNMHEGWKTSANDHIRLSDATVKPHVLKVIMFNVQA